MKEISKFNWREKMIVCMCCETETTDIDSNIITHKFSLWVINNITAVISLDNHNFGYNL